MKNENADEGKELLCICSHLVAFYNRIKNSCFLDSFLQTNFQYIGKALGSGTLLRASWNEILTHSSIVQLGAPEGVNMALFHSGN
jgi:hypothetical protein